MDRLARTHHVRGVDGIADHLQREVSLHAGAHVELAVMHQRPAAMGALDAAQIIGDLGLDHGVDGLCEIMTQENVFGGNRAVGLELEHPMAVRLLDVEDALRRRCDARFQEARLQGPWLKGFAAGRVHGIHLARLLR